MGRKLSAEAYVAIVIALLSLFLSAFVGYSHNDRDISNRVSVIETQQKNDGATIQRVESKVDRLVEWALGSKK
jgi:hypothetical protein